MELIANGIAGSTTRTHGVEGLKYVNYLKSINDARLIRSRVIENFEQACLPTTTDEERRRLLSFVVCGGGPTGVEVSRDSLPEPKYEILPPAGLLFFPLPRMMPFPRGYVSPSFNPRIVPFPRPETICHILQSPLPQVCISTVSNPP